jgi:hypothetical protein
MSARVVAGHATLHAVCSAALVSVTSAGRRHDSLAFDLLMERLRVGRHGRGRPRTAPDEFLAMRPTPPGASTATAAVAKYGPSSP